MMMTGLMAAGGRRLLLACALLCGVLAPAAQAKEPRPGDSLRVEVVQAPAWLERNGRRTPLAAGMQLHNRDRVFTGAAARVQLRLAEGSTLSLGEAAQLTINALGRRDAKTTTAAFVVDRGAFRFSAPVASSSRSTIPAPSSISTSSPRRVNVRVASITAALQQADLWGSADAQRDLLCLLSGSITAVHELDTPRDFTQPLSVYRAPKDEAPLNVDYAGSDEVAGWLAQTELQAAEGVQRAGGRWQVELATLDDEASALDLYDRAREAGFAVRIRPRAGEGGAWRYALRATQLPTRADASALAAKIAAALELKTTRVLP